MERITDAASSWGHDGKKNDDSLVALGLLLLAERPLSGFWAIGTLVGINVIFRGFSRISVGSVARSLAKRLLARTFPSVNRRLDITHLRRSRRS